MKPRVASNRSSVSETSELLPFNKQVLERVRNVTWELQSVYTQIQSQAEQFSSLAQHELLRESSSDMQVLIRFKAAIDQMRRSLWMKLIDVPRPPRSSHESERSARLKQAVAVLAHELSPAAANDTPEPGSFFERLETVIDSYMKQPSQQSKIMKARKA